MTEPVPDPATARKRRLGRTMLACLFLGWSCGLPPAVALGHPGVGIAAGVGGGCLLGVLIAAINGDLRRPPR